MFAVREVPPASLGFSPFELLYRCHPWGVLDLVRQEWEESAQGGANPLSSYMAALREKLKQVATLSKRELQSIQASPKQAYDASVKPWSFEPAQKSTPPATPPTAADKLLMKWQGPYEVMRHQGEDNYKIRIPHKGVHLYHIHLLKV